MLRVTAWAASVACVALLVLAFVRFAWEIVVATLVSIVGLASATWVNEAGVWHASAHVRALPSIWMVAMYATACALLFVEGGLARQIPGEAVVVAFTLAPLPWAIVGGVVALARRRRRRVTAGAVPRSSIRKAGKDHPEAR